MGVRIFCRREILSRGIGPLGPKQNFYAEILSWRQHMTFLRSIPTGSGGIAYSPAKFGASAGGGFPAAHRCNLAPHHRHAQRRLLVVERDERLMQQ
jgi:hypothetical protein